MRDKILQALRDAGHGLTINTLESSTGFIIRRHGMIDARNTRIAFTQELQQMEIDKLIILHRSSGSAGIPKGEIVLITLRTPEPEDFEIVQVGPNAFLRIQKTKR